MHRTHRFALLLTVLMAPAYIFAQETSEASVSQATSRSFGFSTFYGDGVNFGLRTRVTPSLLARPAVGINNSKWKFDYPGAQGMESSSLTLKLALDFLFAKSVYETPHQLQSYFGIGISFDYSEFTPAFPEVRRRLSCHGLLGGAYWMNKQFGFFGELGFSIGDDPSLNGSNFNLSTVSRIGLNFIF